MANKLYEESDIQAIATAIRGKNGSSDTYTVSQMANAINNIPSGGSIVVNNGVLGSYYSETGTVPANSFVEIIKEFEPGTYKTYYARRKYSSFFRTKPNIFIGFLF